MPSARETDDHRYAVIFAGGRGSRLWPLSTADQPKQFLSLNGNRPLIVETFDRLADVVGADRVYVSTTAEYAPMVRERLPDLTADGLIVEPTAQGKVPAYALVAATIALRDPQATFLTTASDSYVAPPRGFAAAAAVALDAVSRQPDLSIIMANRVTRSDVTLGYVQASPDTSVPPGILRVRDFLEKPSQRHADTLVGAQDWFWNTSHYCFHAPTLLTAYRQAAPEVVGAIERFMESGDPQDYQFRNPPAHELDPLVTGGHPIGVVPCDYAWHDVGTWPSYYRALAEHTGSSFVARGPHVDEGSDRVLVYNNTDQHVVTTGLRDVAVVVSNGVVMVAAMDHLDNHGEVVNSLEQANAQSASAVSSNAQPPTKE